MTSIVTALCVLCELFTVGEEMVFIIETSCVPRVLCAQIDEKFECRAYTATVQSNSVTPVNGIDLWLGERGKKHAMKISVSGVRILWQPMATISQSCGI
jgi:hypothetical protein